MHSNREGMRSPNIAARLLGIKSFLLATGHPNLKAGQHPRIVATRPDQNSALPLVVQVQG